METKQTSPNEVVRFLVPNSRLARLIPQRQAAQAHQRTSAQGQDIDLKLVNKKLWQHVLLAGSHVSKGGGANPTSSPSKLSIGINHGPTRLGSEARVARGQGVTLVALLLQGRKHQGWGSIALPMASIPTVLSQFSSDLPLGGMPLC